MATALTKFEVTYLKAVPELMTTYPESAYVSLPCTTREEAAARIAVLGGFVDEKPTKKFITPGAILQIDILT